MGWTVGFRADHALGLPVVAGDALADRVISASNRRRLRHCRIDPTAHTTNGAKTTNAGVMRSQDVHAGRRVERQSADRPAITTSQGFCTLTTVMTGVIV